MTLLVACEALLEPEDIDCDCGNTPPEEIAEMIDAASDIIAIITGGKVSGRCTDVVRPCNSSFSCGCATRSCACSPAGIVLRGPMPEITQILIDGAAFVDYAIVDGTLLVRTDGRGWPGNQDITKPSTEVGTFEITYDYGLPTSTLAARAGAEIVCSFLRSGPQDTRKPHPNTRSMSIAGVTIGLDQMAAEIKRRAFMMPDVTRLLTVYAPDGPTPAFVYSPELEDGWKLHSVEPYSAPPVP
jgi:hypothetical protein